MTIVCDLVEPDEFKFRRVLSSKFGCGPFPRSWTVGWKCSLDCPDSANGQRNVSHTRLCRFPGWIVHCQVLRYVLGNNDRKVNTS
jgi:hypothetical protein